MKRSVLTIILCFILIFTGISLIVRNPSVIERTDSKDIDRGLRASAAISETREWLNNTGFSTTADWYYSRDTDESNPDYDADISSDEGNFIILGDKKEFSAINGTPSNSDWFPEKKPGLTIFPDRYNISQ